MTESTLADERSPNTRKLDINYKRMGYESSDLYNLGIPSPEPISTERNQLKSPAMQSDFSGSNSPVSPKQTFRKADESSEMSEPYYEDKIQMEPKHVIIK
jgi:hypothetical protein